MNTTKVIEVPAASLERGASLHRALISSVDLFAQVRRGISLTQALESSPKDIRSAVQSLSYTAFRFKPATLKVLATYIPKKMSDEVEDLLVLAAATLYPESPNHYPAHTLVNETVKAAGNLPKIAHAKGMINAVLRRLIEHPQDFDILLNRHQNHYPQWWTYKLQKAYPKEWQKILKTNLFPAKLFVRVNPKVFTREEYLEELRKVHMSALEIPPEILKLAPQAICLEQSMPISKLPHFASGGVCVQDLGAQMAGHLLSPKDGEDVLDACAAPGGKSTHLLELANISLTALEINQGRLAKVNENITRLDLSAKLLVGDASKPELWWDKKQFDRILADTPCSATGIIRRHPDILYLRRESDFAGLKITQQQILRSLWDLLKPGGELLYVSCSIFPEEGEEQIQLFLEEHPNALRLNSLNQLLPSEWHDGFFYGKLQKLT